MTLELDHLFVFVEADGPEPALLEAIGLRESYRRRHPGQGTSNTCYCFDNAFLELLWLVDEDEARSPAVARTQLAERARWRHSGGSPFGIALRTADATTTLSFSTWRYAAPYLPPDKAIPVAELSDDLAQPFVFQSPGAVRPDLLSGERLGERQSASGLRGISSVALLFPEGQTPAPDLQRLGELEWLTIGRSGDAPQVVLTLARDKGAPLRLRLPDCRLLPDP